MFLRLLAFLVLYPSKGTKTPNLPIMLNLTSIADGRIIANRTTSQVEQRDLNHPCWSIFDVVACPRAPAAEETRHRRAVGLRSAPSRAAGDRVFRDRVTPTGPTVSGVDPPMGPSTGGTTVTVAGTGFDTGSGTPTVDFGPGNPGTGLILYSNLLLTVVSPPGTGTGRRHRNDHPGHVADKPGRPVHLYVLDSTGGDGSLADQRASGRRHIGDDHR